MTELPAIAVTVNHTLHTLPAGSVLTDAVAAAGVTPPFAAAVNLQFVPRSQHGSYCLQAGDRIELIAPITGG